MTVDADGPLERWRDTARAAPIPASARGYVDDLYRELKVFASGPEPPVEAVAAAVRGGEGTNRRARALRILHRLGEVDRALAALEEARRAGSG